MSQRIALVHERFTEIAGSEHVVEQFSVQWPQARIYAPIARSEGIPAGLASTPITSSTQKLYEAIKMRSYAPVLPLVPRAFRRMPVGDADVVITSHHAFAASVVHATDAPVIAYVHSPARWAWEPEMRAGEADGKVGAAALAGLAALARRAESSSAPKLRMIVANSTVVAQRVRDWWQRDSIVVPPPVDTDAFTPDSSVAREDFFLMAGRLVPYKRPDIAVRAAKAAGVKLVVAGDGRYLQYCQSLAGPETTFLGRVSHDTLVDLHRRAAALVMPGLEDFGIVPVEAMACGTPVLALGAGGALDSVRAGATGEFVKPGSSDDELVAAFAEAMSHFSVSAYDPTVIRAHAETFSRAVFRERMAEVVAQVSG